MQYTKKIRRQIEIIMNISKIHTRNKNVKLINWSIQLEFISRKYGSLHSSKGALKSKESSEFMYKAYSQDSQKKNN